MAAQDFGADRMERAEPGHALGDRSGERRDALLHLARRLVGEGDGEDFMGPRATGRQNMGDAGGQHPCLAGAGPGEHEDRPVERLDRRALLGVEPGEITAGAGRRPGARGDAAGTEAAGRLAGRRERKGLGQDGLREKATECESPASNVGRRRRNVDPPGRLPTGSYNPVTNFAMITMMATCIRPWKVTA